MLDTLVYALVLGSLLFIGNFMINITYCVLQPERMTRLIYEILRFERCFKCKRMCSPWTFHCEHCDAPTKHMCLGCLNSFYNLHLTCFARNKFALHYSLHDCKKCE